MHNQLNRQLARDHCREIPQRPAQCESSCATTSNCIRAIRGVAGGACRQSSDVPEPISTSARGGGGSWIAFLKASLRFWRKCWNTLGVGGDYGHQERHTSLRARLRATWVASISVQPNAREEHQQNAPRGRWAQLCNPRSRTDQGLVDCRPNAMIGVPMGAVSGVVAIDPDAPKEDKDADGRRAWALLLAQHGATYTHTHLTPGGGKHILFRHDPERPRPTVRVACRAQASMCAEMVATSLCRRALEQMGRSTRLPTRSTFSTSPQCPNG